MAGEKRILITGATGQVGVRRRLIDRMLGESRL